MIKQFHKDFYIERDMFQQALPESTMFNLIHRPTIIKVDCVIRKDTPYRRKNSPRRQSVYIEGHPLDHRRTSMPSQFLRDQPSRFGDLALELPSEKSLCRVFVTTLLHEKIHATPSYLTARH